MGRPTTFPAPWSGLAARAGGVAKLAIALRVNTSTVRRWASGEMRPSGAAQGHINAVAGLLGIAPIYPPLP